jgi:glycosyltransferase involved in cell wall biosynthesis
LTRVLHCVHAFPPEPSGGTERHVLGLARAQRARGHDARVAAGSWHGRPALEEVSDETEGVPVIRLHRDDLQFERWHRGHHPGLSDRFDELLARERPDVVHVHHWLRLSLDLGQRARARGIPVVVTLHDSYATCPTIHRLLPDGTHCRTTAQWQVCRTCLGSEYPEFEDLDADALRLRQQVLAAELQAAARVFVLSRAQLDLLRPLLPDVPLEVQPFTAFVALRRSPPPAAHLPLQVASLGHVNAGKAQHLLLQAVRALPHPEQVVVHVFGEANPAEYEARLRRLAEGLRVEWHGHYQYERLEATPLHLVVLASTLPETYGLVLDEARMLGVPVLASDVGAYRERIGAGGVLFPAGGVGPLRDLLARCLAEPGFLAALRSGVTSPPPPDWVVDHFERVYREARSAVDPRAAGAQAAPRWDAALAQHAFRRADRLERLLGRSVRVPDAPGP